MLALHLFAICFSLFAMDSFITLTFSTSNLSSLINMIEGFLLSLISFLLIKNYDAFKNNKEKKTAFQIKRSKI
jgi:positive regulator of sigma E activity